MSLTISFKISEFAEIVEDLPNISRHFAHVEIASLFANKDKILENDFDCFALNPRKQNIKTPTCKNIHNSLLVNEYFHYLNKGIIFSVEKLTKKLDEGIVEVVLSDENIHGNIDGGHTLKVIFDLDESEIDEIKDKCVFFEFITGLKDKNFSSELSKSRNSSSLLDKSSKLNFLGHYEEIKEILKNETLYPFKDRVIYGKNEGLDFEKNIRKIKIVEIIHIMGIFNAEFNDFSEFSKKFASSSDVYNKKFFDTYSKDSMKGDLKRKEKIWVEIFHLWDEIEYWFFKEFSKDSRKFDVFTRKGFFKERSATVKSKFYEKYEMKLYGRYYNISIDFVMPIFAAFNCLIDAKSYGTDWKMTPLSLFEKIKKPLANKVFECASQRDINSVAFFTEKSWIWENIWNFVNELKNKEI